MILSMTLDSTCVLDLVWNGSPLYQSYAPLVNICQHLQLDWNLSFIHTHREGKECVEWLMFYLKKNTLTVRQPWLYV
jgi:hypothetical protein